MRKQLLTLILVLLAALACPLPVLATEHVVGTCTPAGIKAKTDLATNAGDGVFIDCDAVSFTTAADVCAVEWIAPANAYLRGRGSLSTVGGGNLTILTDAISRSGGDKWALCITLPGTGTFDFRGITVQGSASNSNGMIAVGEAVNGSGAQIRMHHSSFNPVSGIGILFSGQIYAVVDHSVFDMTNSTGMKYWASRWGGDPNVEGDGSWADDTHLGTTKFVWAEDNEFISNLVDGSANSVVQDSYLGSRFGLRFNTMTNCPATQTHPTGGSGRARGTRAFEIYGNVFTCLDEAHNFNTFFLSSGTGVVWGNAAPLGFDSFITLHSMRRDNSTYTQAATPSGWGYCGTSFNGTGSNWDRNDSAATGSPCLDQPGRGKGDLLENDPPENATLGCDSSTACWPRQALEPIYEFLNTFAGDITGDTTTISNDGHFTDGLDYLRQANDGVRVGNTLPSTCTTRQGFWKLNEGSWRTALPTTGYTGQGVLYKCTATNTWTAFYTPLVYPHPFVTADDDTDPDPAVGPAPSPAGILVR